MQNRRALRLEQLCVARLGVPLIVKTPHVPFWIAECSRIGFESKEARTCGYSTIGERAALHYDRAMPELPEVQTVVNDLLAAGLVGCGIHGAKVFWSRCVEPMEPSEFSRLVANRSVEAIQRRGKYLVLKLSQGWLLIHLRMTGRLEIVSPSSERDKHEHVIFDLDDGRQLRFHDTRKFGRMHITRDPSAVLDALGLEPLGEEFTAGVLGKMLRSRKRSLKPLLLDQTFIAGIGNIYCDESLWQARLHPLRRSTTLTDGEIHALHIAIRSVLNKAIRNLGTSLGTGEANFSISGGRSGRNRDSLMVFRRAKEPCKRCASIIRRIVVGQRGTFVCTQCQPR